MKDFFWFVSSLSTVNHISFLLSESFLGNQPAQYRAYTLLNSHTIYEEGGANIAGTQPCPVRDSLTARLTTPLPTKQFREFRFGFEPETGSVRVAITSTTAPQGLDKACMHVHHKTSQLKTKFKKASQLAK
jgi:hypothetical protein